MRTSKIRNSLLTLFVFAVLAIGMSANAEETEAMVEKQVETEMPVLKGDLWVKMTPESKLAFIWGAGHVITIEQMLMQQYPELKRDSFVLKVAEANVGSNMKMNDVVAVVDTYYAKNPDNLDTPVIHVIWDTLIKPNIKTGIAGEPLN